MPQIYSAGYNANGQLGDNTITNKSFPVTIVRQDDYDKISVGNYHSLAIESLTGQVWGWGNNDYGEIGDGTTSDRSSPVSILGTGQLTPYVISVISAGQNYSLAIDSYDGSIWSWGRNDSGQLGDNSLTDRSSPVGIARIGSYIKIAGWFNQSNIIEHQNKIDEKNKVTTE